MIRIWDAFTAGTLVLVGLTMIITTVSDVVGLGRAAADPCWWRVARTGLTCIIVTGVVVACWYESAPRWLASGSPSGPSHRPDRPKGSEGGGRDA